VGGVDTACEPATAAPVVWARRNATAQWARIWALATRCSTTQLAIRSITKRLRLPVADFDHYHAHVHVGE